MSYNSILAPYLILVDFLAITLGPDYEVALHDFTDKSGSIITIANNHITGRSIGAPLSKTSLEAISKEVYRHQDYIVYDANMTSKGKMIRTCTLFLKDPQDNLVALLCINFDDSRYQRLIQDVLKLCHPDNFVEQKYIYKTENDVPTQSPGANATSLHSTMEGVVEDILTKLIDGMGTPIERLLPDEKQYIVEIMSGNGVFILKGAVKYVAKRLNCSQASLYRYMKKNKE